MTSTETRPDADDLTDIAEATGVYRDLTAGQWRRNAACARPGVDRRLFYPSDWPMPQRGFAVRAAKWVCGRCPVRSECLAWALELPVVEDHGIVGATSPKERQRLRGDRRDRTA